MGQGIKWAINFKWVDNNGPVEISPVRKTPAGLILTIFLIKEIRVQGANLSKWVSVYHRNFNKDILKPRIGNVGF
jgi:hypothetical protein